jgi:hypothetical protein
MPKKYIVFLKTIWRSWFLILVAIIIILAIYNPPAAIILTIITIILFVLSYIPSFFFKNRLLRFLKKYYRIEESDIIREFGKDRNKIRKILFEMSQNQQNRNWLIILLNSNYIFYHSDLVEKFKTLYNKGSGEKEIYETLKKIDIETRAEIKAIEDTLKRNQRLDAGKQNLEEEP